MGIYFLGLKNIQYYIAIAGNLQGTKLSQISQLQVMVASSKYNCEVLEVTRCYYLYLLKNVFLYFSELKTYFTVSQKFRHSSYTVYILW